MKKFGILALLVLLMNCSTKKNVIYLQGSSDNTVIEYNYKDNKIKADDILKIDISALLPETVIQYSKISDKNATSSLDVLKVQGYKVKNDGSITFPVLGNIKLAGITISDAEKLIYNLLLDGGHLLNHSVEIRLLNAHVSILGDVANPGTYTYIENNMNILKAIGLAGDLNITANRVIKLIREINGKRIIQNIDLTDISYLSSPYYQIHSGDIILVDPNTTKVKTAGIIGNSGTLVSLLSFILTSIILITN